MSRVLCLPLVFGLMLALAATGHAQCSDLTVSGSLSAGGDVIFDVTGATPDSPTAVFVSTQQASTTIGGGMFTLNLALGFPRILVGFGSTDSAGDFSHTVNIPPVPAGISISPITLHAQAVTVDLSGFMPPNIMLGFCESDVETFTLTF